jgi:hypothetical protein
LYCIDLAIVKGVLLLTLVISRRFMGLIEKLSWHPAQVSVVVASGFYREIFYMVASGRSETESNVANRSLI